MFRDYPNSIFFGTFPGFAQLSFWQEKHVNEKKYFQPLSELYLPSWKSVHISKNSQIKNDISIRNKDLA